MKTKHTVIATCIATLFFSGAVFAKDSWNYHENEWNSVKSYGKVAIAQDSVEQWGPWEDFAEPAAGLIAPASLLGFAKNEPYRNNPDVNPTPQPSGCAAGAWCGYAIFKNSQQNEYSMYYSEGSKHHSNPWTAALFTLMPTPDDPSITAGDGRGPGSIFWELTSLGTTQPTFSDAGAAIPADFGGGYWFLGDDGLHHYHTDQYLVEANGVSHNVFSTEARNTFGYGAFTDAITGHFYKFGPKKWDVVWVPSNPEVAIGNFERMAEYVYGEERSFSSYSQDSTRGYYVAGIATPEAYLSTQRAGNVNATYVGGSFDGQQQGTVRINVQFGSATWDGTWNGSLDFKASGNIAGANIASNSISAANRYDNATYSGFVQGTFYGQQAGSIGGVSSVTKTPAVPSGEMARMVQQQPQTQTAIFLVNKVPTATSTPK